MHACLELNTALLHAYTNNSRQPGSGRGQLADLLHHSTTVLLYLLPPYGPLAKQDLVMMSALSRHVPLLPVIPMPDTAASEEAVAFQASVAAMLADPSRAGIRNLAPVKTFR